MNTRNSLFLVVILIFLSGCTTTSYLDNIGQGYAPVRNTIYNQRAESILVKAGFNVFDVNPGEFRPLGTRCGTEIIVTWKDKNGKPGGRNYQTPCNKGDGYLTVK